jgi:hypothetical protein
VRLALGLAAACCMAGCGGNGGKAGARAPVKRYLAALGRGDAAGACRELTGHSREQLAEFGHEHLEADRSCAAVVALLLGNRAGAGLRRLGSARIGVVEIHGDAGEVRVSGLDRPIDVAYTGGHWRITSAPSGETD